MLREIQTKIRTPVSLEAVQTNYREVREAIDARDYDKAERIAGYLTTSERTLEHLEYSQIEFLDGVVEGLARPNDDFSDISLEPLEPLQGSEIDPRLPSVQKSIEAPLAYKPTGRTSDDRTAAFKRWGLDIRVNYES